MILFIDDEPTTDLFFDELQGRGLPIRKFRSVDEAWEYLAKTNKPLDLAIVDVMMPPGELFSKDDVSDGLHTGLSFYKLIRQKYETIPVYLLTNLTQSTVARSVDGDPNAYIAVKTDIFYDDFAEQVEDLYNKSRNYGGK